MDQEHTVLVVGAAGKFAHYVVPYLVQRGMRVRGMIRSASEAAAVTQLGAEAVVADLTDMSSVAHACQGVERVFYIAPAFLPNEAEVGCLFVKTAVACGVKRIVFSSVIHPVISSLINHAAKAPVEEAILNSGLEYTFLHPALYFQNLAASWEKIVETGVFAEPWSTDTRFSRVDYRDVAEVAAIALTDDRLLYGTFELAAEGWLDRHDMAHFIGNALGREIKAEKADVKTLGNIGTPIKTMFAHYDHVGLLGNPLTLRAILGREPRTLRDYINELAAEDGVGLKLK